MSSLRSWIAGARPRTLTAALAPVLVGTAVAGAEGTVIWWRAGACALLSLALQVGTNYANDYSDGVRGTDAVRAGPLRLVGSGTKTAAAVKRAAAVAFAIAATAGLALAAATTWWLLAVGALCLAAGVLYTGGPRPYGYSGLGEIAVLVFFGYVATCGSAFVHLDRIAGAAIAGATAVGLVACALLLANNIRDAPTDRSAGKRTLAVRFGDRPARVLYVVCALAPAVVAAGLSVRRPWCVLALLCLPDAVMCAAAMWNARAPRQFILILGSTAWLQLEVAVLLSAGLLLGSL